MNNFKTLQVAALCAAVWALMSPSSEAANHPAPAFGAVSISASPSVMTAAVSAALPWLSPAQQAAGGGVQLVDETFSSTAANQYDTCSTYGAGETCSAQGMSGECSSTGGGGQTYCSANVSGGFCSVAADGGGGGNCSTLDSSGQGSFCSTMNGGAQCSVENSGSCSSNYINGWCSAVTSSSASSNCSVVVGGSGRCTTFRGGARNCSTQEGALGHCSTFTPGGAPVTGGGNGAMCEGTPDEDPEPVGATPAGVASPL